MNPRFLNDKQAAELLGVGERSFSQFVADGVPWLPTPIVLGPRLRRWDADELIDRVRKLAPRGGPNPEPAQLAKAKGR